MQLQSLNKVKTMIEWWSKRDASAALLSLVATAVPAIALQYFVNPPTEDLAMMLAVPMIVLYLFARLVALLASRSEPKPHHVNHPFVHVCTWIAAVAWIACIVAFGSWAVFSYFGPRQVVVPTFYAALTFAVSVLLSIGCAVGHEPILKGHRLIVRPALETAESEIIAMVSLLKKIISRGQPPAFRLP